MWLNQRMQYVLLFVALVLIGQSGCVAAQESAATRQLFQRNAEFRQEVIQVSERVYTAVGFGVSAVSMVVGDDGIVIVDTGIDIAAGERVREAFRDITAKPVKAIVFTHGHGDHTLGAAAFMDSDDVQVWAHKDFGDEQRSLEQAGINIQKQRGASQAGFRLTPEERINNGIAKVYWPGDRAKVFAAGRRVAPTHFVTTQQATLSIAGLELELITAGGETEDHVSVWFAEDQVAFSGDNFYKSWPNLYALRGTQYRDIRAWIKAIDRILQDKPEAVVAGHTRPVIGAAQVQEVLGNYRDAIEFLFNKTVEGINLGLTPNELVEYVELPEQYASLDYLQPYYGNPEWAIRAIFSGYLGWYDGNPTNLFPLTNKTEAERVVDLAGGMPAAINAIQVAMEKQDYQWVAQLSDYVLTLDPKQTEALLAKADALTALAFDTLTATARNYYLTVAKQLRARAAQPVIASSEADANTEAEVAIRVTLLGTGTPLPNPRQFSQTILVEANGVNLLFDCGRGCTHRLWNLGPKYIRQTEHVFLTHLHSDHTIGLPELYLNGWNLLRRAQLKIYGPEKTVDLMRGIRNAYDEDVYYRVEKQVTTLSREHLEYTVIPVADQYSVEIGGVTVTAIKVDHHVIEPAYGYRIDFGGHSVVISGDTAYSENLIKASQGADVVIHEVMSPALERFIRANYPEDMSDDIVALHTLAPDVGRVFDKTNTRLGVYTHLDNNPKGLPELIEQTRTTWSGPLEIGEDLMRIDIGEEIVVHRPGH
ncbi:MAG: alkyl sulfatase dimerization domain-containing protein [Pseudomonadota bacterium]